ncbi:MAG: NAD-dependent epimerase/dehydratase family protein [Chloroflexota bacterium]|nr:NAD-dependent epimerase/dehydratase family protein [Chloroflexota bacterium]
MTNDYWNGRRVLVTGAPGFIGSHVTDLLVESGARVTVAVLPEQVGEDMANLHQVEDRIDMVAAELSLLDDCRRACRGQDVVFSLAHLDGSVAFKRDKPALVFRQNMLITLNLLEAAHEAGVDRFLVMSSAEVYSPEVSAPMEEADGFRGRPSRTSDGYSWSKRMSEFAAELYSREHGLKVAIARPSNVYGPRDGFELHRGRVIPMFIRKVHESNDSLVIWGSGEQSRSFLYVGDLARGLLDLVEKYPVSDPVNFSGEREISIAELAQLIVRLSGCDVDIVYDLDKPAGPPNRILSREKAIELLGFRETVSLESGLQRTIEYYCKDGLASTDRQASLQPMASIQEKK